MGDFVLRRFAVLWAVAFSAASLLGAQEKDPVRLTAEVKPMNVRNGNWSELVILCEIVDGYHISDAKSGLFEILPDPTDGIDFRSIAYPEGEEDSFGSFYRGKVSVSVPFTVSKKVMEGRHSITARVKIQPCDEKSGVCYPPEIRTVAAEFIVLSASNEGQANVEEEHGIAGRLSNALERGSVIAFLIVFLGGILTSLTPCVYPMIPITIAVIGAQATGSRMRGFVLSLVYVLGISFTFSGLGLIAAKTGGLFGAYARHPVVLILIASIFFMMGLSMLGVFVLQMPSALASKLRGRKRSGILGALLTGLLAGFIVSPCISPILVVILTWVAKSGSVMLGIGLLFSFALGLGLLFILIGTFSGVLKNLPKSGGWMEFVERGFGILLVILAIVFLKPLFSQPVYFLIWSAFFIFFGTFIGAFTPMGMEAGRRRKIGKAVGLLAIFAGASLTFFGMAGLLGVDTPFSVEGKSLSTESTMWIATDTEGFRRAKMTGKPVLMDFYAEWCTACKELDEKTWPDASVRSVLEGFILVKLDLTKNDDRSRAYQNQYGVIGMPTVILFDALGREKYRFEGYRSPEEVAAILREYSE